jgi:hypothetical protein
MITTQKLTGDELAWDLMKFCKGFKAQEIKVCTIRGGQHLELVLHKWEGDTKSEKIKTLVGVIDHECFDDIDVILPNSHSYNF